MNLGCNNLRTAFRFSSWIRGSIVLLASSAAVSAQILPSRPISFANGSITFGAEFSATWGSNDTGYFNYTSYEVSALRRIRAGLSASWKPAAWMSVLGEARIQTGAPLQLYALFLRVRPWPTRSFDIQAGLIPPTFGAYPRRSYPQDNPLIGDPLLYQYLTSVRTEAVPASADDVLRMRGRGWLVSYPIGDAYAEGGVPVASVLAWNTGVGVRVGSSPVEIAAAITSGSLSQPGRGGHFTTPEVAARATFTPSAGLIVGVSAEQGPILADSVLDALPPGTPTSSLLQRALGMDLEYSRDHWLIRGELIANQWRLPSLQSPALSDPLGVLGWYIEGRYRLLPQLYAAARVDHLGFGTIAGTLRSETWDANVTRTEAGLGYYLQRNVILKGAWQHNTRDGGRLHRNDLGSVQLLYWF